MITPSSMHLCEALLTPAAWKPRPRQPWRAVRGVGRHRRRARWSRNMEHGYDQRRSRYAFVITWLVAAPQ